MKSKLRRAKHQEQAPHAREKPTVQLEEPVSPEFEELILQIEEVLGYRNADRVKIA